MLKLIVLDLDGVLIDAKEIHYETLNRALIEENLSPITREAHLRFYDGLSTRQKLNKIYSGDIEVIEKVIKLKQKYTSEAINKLEENIDQINTLRRLKVDYKLVVASNSIRDTVRDALSSTKIMRFFDFYLSNEDVKNPKPNSEIYLQCMIKAGVNPKETLIIEDSYHGRKAADQSGALVMGVNSPKDVTYDNIIKFIQNKENNTMTKWQDSKLNILIPMAGRGSRFEAAGYTFPKPLIEVHGKPMIQVVTENLNIDANYIYIVQKEHYDKYNLKTLLNLITPNCNIVVADEITKGAACTTLLAFEFINFNNPLLIANSDQVLEWDSSGFMYDMMGDYVDGGIVTFTATHPKWSFAKVNEDNFVTEVAEKNPISDKATAGVYFWKKGYDYVKYANQMISKNIRTNNEFYVCPVFNEAIQDNKRIKTFHINKMWGIGTPEDLNYYLENHKV